MPQGTGTFKGSSVIEELRDAQKEKIERWRPKTCPDTECMILWNNYIEKHVECGGSFNCFGKMHTTDILLYKAVTHVNDYSHCVCAPNGQHIKRHTRYMINEGDAMMIVLGFVSILDDADPKYIHKFLQKIIDGEVTFRIGEL